MSLQDSEIAELKEALKEAVCVRVLRSKSSEWVAMRLMPLSLLNCRAGGHGGQRTGGPGRATADRTGSPAVCDHVMRHVLRRGYALAHHRCLGGAAGRGVAERCSGAAPADVDLWYPSAYHLAGASSRCRG